jgi:peptide/nickel transport system substrate-binding protein
VPGGREGNDVTTTLIRPRSQRGLALFLALGVLASLLFAAFSGPSAHAADSKEVVFTVGTKQDVDNMNPYSGVVLSAYEVWNMQYNVLVNLSASDMGPVPEVATSWTRSPDGLTWTFKIRDDIKWSDGKPLTSADVAYTFNRTAKEEWSNFSPFTEGFKSVTAPDPTTVVITTKEPDPRLPSLPVYILPKHVWEKYSAKTVGSFLNTNPVTSGPFRLTAWNKGSYFEMTANKNYWGPKPAVDKVRFRIFRNDEAMAAALKNGEIDAIYNLAPDLAGELKGQSNITPVNAQDGSFTQVTMNTGSGKIGNGHPALQDVRVRQAIAHAIDKDTLVSRVLDGLGTSGQSMNVAVAPKWNLKIPEAQQMKFDLAQANQILDDAGYKKGSDGIRTMNDGSGKKLNFRFFFPSDDNVYSRDVEFIKEWLKDIGIGTTPTPKSEDELTPIENKGQFDLIIWGWTPYADPTAMMSYLTCGQVPKKPDDGLYNDAFFCDPQYDQLFNAQKTELDETKRVDLVHQALQRFYDQAPYVVLYQQDTIEAYRNDRYTGFVRQPAETGPVIYTQSDPSYSLIKPISTTSGSSSSGGSTKEASGSSDSGGSSSTGLIIGIGVLIIIVVGGGIFFARRRKTADERE